MAKYDGFCQNFFDVVVKYEFKAAKQWFFSKNGFLRLKSCQKSRKSNVFFKKRLFETEISSEKP